MSRWILGLGGLVAVTTSQIAVAAHPGPAAEARVAIQAVLDRSAAAWSAGDLYRFMDCYERATTTSYVSGARFVQGYDAIRAMYAERFGGGSRAAMGQLAVEVLDVRLLGHEHAYVVGRFHLRRPAAAGGDATGLTTLTFLRTGAGWRIIADHS